jgi:DNA-binding response OmpR family regulator
LESKEIWFTSWGDDYLTKPFSLKELLLRVRNLIKREKNLDSLNVLTYKDLQLNQDTKQVTKNWKIINLTPKEFKILQELMLNKWKVVSKEDLLVSIRGYNNDIYSDVIRTHIKSLRDKIWQEYIKTVRWMWFILEE